MAATPYPTDYVYAGNAVALTLKTAVSDGGGDLTLTVNEETATKGWPSLGAGQRFVIVVGRGTAYETKYAVKTITSSVSGSTLIVDSADKTFDNTPVTAAPAGTVVEHCWSATEASLANDHMRTKQAHGSDGDLVDQNTAQLLSNKTVMTPTASGHPTTKAYVDAADALLLPKAGGTMSGAIAMGGAKITGLGNGTASGDAVNLGQLDTIGAYATWTPTITAATTSPSGFSTQTGRYSQVNKHASGWGKCLFGGSAAAGSGQWRFPLPAAPAQSTHFPRIGFGMIVTSSAIMEFQLELGSSVDYCNAIITGRAFPYPTGYTNFGMAASSETWFDELGAWQGLGGASYMSVYGWQDLQYVSSTTLTSGGLVGSSVLNNAHVSWQFDYEVA